MNFKTSSFYNTARGFSLLSFLLTLVILGSLLSYGGNQLGAVFLNRSVIENAKALAALLEHTALKAQALRQTLVLEVQEKEKRIISLRNGTQVFELSDSIFFGEVRFGSLHRKRHHIEFRADASASPGRIVLHGSRSFCLITQSLRGKRTLYCEGL